MIGSQLLPHLAPSGWRPGRDSRAVRIAPRPPARQPAYPLERAVVVGGGLAGISAAVTLAEAGVSVDLVERDPQLGGRVASWPVDDPVAGPITMSRGFHAFFRQYYNLRALLRRTDPTFERLTPLSDYPLLSATGVRDSFAAIPRTPPWNLLGFVLRSPSFRLRDLGRVDVRAALELLDVDFPSTFEKYDGESAAAFLDRLRFPDSARHLALEVFARSFFAHPEDFSAGELVAMFHTYFVGSAEGLLFDVPTDDYGTAYLSPLGAYLHGLGARIRTGTRVGRVRSDADGVEVELADGASLRADAAVLATDPRGLRALVADGTFSGPSAWRERVLRTRNAPPFAVARLWLDGPVRPDRAAFLGTTGFGPLDNVTVLDRYEAGAAAWSRRTGGSVVETHAYALPGATVADVDGGEVAAELRRRLAQVYPETAAAEALAEECVVADDCWAIGPEPWRDRPEAATGDPRVVLAGDGIRCDHPVALMERAVTTGVLAANRLLTATGRSGQELWTVPPRGRFRRGRQPGNSPRERNSQRRSA